MAENIKLPARMDMSAAQKLVQQLSDVDLSNGVAFDAEEVTHLGALSAQVLIAAARATKEAGAQMSLDQVSEKVDGQLALMGLSAETIAEGLQ